MDRREQITRIIEAVYNRGDNLAENETRAVGMFKLAVRLELEQETAPAAQNPGPAPVAQKNEKPARR